MNQKTTPEQLLFRVADVARILDCGLTKAYELITDGKLETVLVGADRRVTVASLRRLAGAEPIAASGDPETAGATVDPKFRRRPRNKPSATTARGGRRPVAPKRSSAVKRVIQAA